MDISGECFELKGGIETNKKYLKSRIAFEVERSPRQFERVAVWKSFV